MELVAQQHPPLRLQRRRERSAAQRRERAEHLGGDEVALGPAVRALGAALGGERPAVQLEVELADPGRRPALVRAALGPREEVVDPAEALAGQRGEGGQLARPLGHLGREPAPAVAVADGQQALRVAIAAAVVAPGGECGNRPDDAVVAAVGVVEQVREHARAVQPFPPEQVVGEAVGLRPRELAGEEAVDAGAAQQLRQRRGEAEAVRQPADRVLGAEARAEAPLAVQELAHEGLSGGHDAVGLDPHPADRLDAALGDQLGDAVQERGVVLLQEGVDLRGGLAEGQLRMAAQQRDRGRERPSRLAARLGQRPAPGEVEVGVAGEQQRAGGREALAQRGQVAVEPGVGLRHRGALLVAQRRWVRVEVAGQLPDEAHEPACP